MLGPKLHGGTSNTKKLVPVQPSFLCCQASRVVRFSLFQALGSWGRARKKGQLNEATKGRLNLLALVLIQFFFLSLVLVKFRSPSN